MTDEQIEKALECCCSLDTTACEKCPYFELRMGKECVSMSTNDAIALIKRQKEEISRLEYTLLGVMHSVDKWLEGAELEQDEVKRAITMREKTLSIVEGLQAENEEQDQAIINALYHMKVVREEARAEAIREFVRRLTDVSYPTSYSRAVEICDIRKIAREMMEEQK